MTKGPRKLVMHLHAPPPCEACLEDGYLKGLRAALRMAREEGNRCLREHESGWAHGAACVEDRIRRAAIKARTKR